MLSLHGLAVTAVVAAVAVAPAAEARPDGATGAKQRSVTRIDKVSPDVRYGIPRPTTPTVDRVSPDARYGVPDPDTPTIVPQTRVVEVQETGFEWTDAAIGGGVALALALVIAGGAMVVRPHRATAIR